MHFSFLPWSPKVAKPSDLTPVLAEKMWSPETLEKRKYLQLGYRVSAGAFIALFAVGELFVRSSRCLTQKVISSIFPKKAETRLEKLKARYLKPALIAGLAVGVAALSIYAYNRLRATSSNEGNKGKPESDGYLVENKCTLTTRNDGKGKLVCKKQYKEFFKRLTQHFSRDQSKIVEIELTPRQTKEWKRKMLEGGGLLGPGTQGALGG
jgi:hypothetical protein